MSNSGRTISTWSKSLKCKTMSKIQQKETKKSKEMKRKQKKKMKNRNRRKKKQKYKKKNQKQQKRKKRNKFKQRKKLIMRVTKKRKITMKMRQINKKRMKSLKFSYDVYIAQMGIYLFLAVLIQIYQKMQKKKDGIITDKKADRRDSELQWPIYKFQKHSRKFWSRDTTLSNPVLFESSLMRLGKRKKKACSYYYRVISNGYLKYFKNERDKGAKGQIKLTFHIMCCVIEIKDLQTIGLKIYQTLDTFITLYSSEEQILSLISAIKSFCLMNGFEKIYKSIKYLGSGSFGKVYKVQNKYSSQEFAAKIYTKEQYDNHHNKMRLSQMIENEIEILKKFQDPNIMQLLDVFQEEDRLILVCELIQGVELYDYITEVKRMEEKDAAHVIKKVCQGLETIHQNGYVHRDIKLENIMVRKMENGEFNVKIVDFGFAEKVNEEKLLNKAGTPGYIPPELFESKPFTDKGDIFSLGVILYAIVSGYSCFYGKNVQEITKDNKRCNVTFNKKVWREVSASCKDLLGFMLQKIPQLRYSAEQCLKSQWLKMNTTESSMQDIHEVDEIEELQLSKMRQSSYHQKSNESSNGSFQYEFSHRDVKSFYARSSNKTFRTEKTSKSNFSQRSKISNFSKKSQNIRSSTFRQMNNTQFQQKEMNKSRTSKTPKYEKRSHKSFNSSFKKASSSSYSLKKSSIEVNINDDDLIDQKNIKFLDLSYKIFNIQKKRNLL